MVINVIFENLFFYRFLDFLIFLFGVEICGFCLKKYYGIVFGVLEEEVKKVCFRSYLYRIFY